MQIYNELYRGEPLLKIKDLDAELIEKGISKFNISLLLK